MTVAAPPLSLQALLDIGSGLAAAAPHSARLAVDASESRRGFLRLLATDAYEAWLLAWPPGSGIEPHDHGGSHGVFVVVAGNLTESRWQGGQRRRRVLGPGQAATVPTGVVHGVTVRGEQPALAFTSIRRRSPRCASTAMTGRPWSASRPCPLTDARRSSTVLRTALLVLLKEEPNHGYDLVDRLVPLGLVTDRSAVYRTLRSMDRRGDLRSAWCASERGPARRVYEVTEAGLRLLQRGLDGMSVHRVAVDHVLRRSQAAAVS